MYHTLYVRIGELWSPEFGDHDLQIVVDEATDSYSDQEWIIQSHPEKATVFPFTMQPTT